MHIRTFILLAASFQLHIVDVNTIDYNGLYYELPVIIAIIITIITFY